MDLTEKAISSEYVFEGRVLKVRVDDVLLPNGSKSKREVAQHTGAVAILPVTDDNKVMLVRQFRYAYKEHLIEIPAGRLDREGESPEEAARRELSEEINRKCEKLIPMGVMYPSPGAQYEPLYIYAATGLSECNGKLDEDEFVEPLIMDMNELLARVLSGEIRDAKTCVAVMKYALMKDVSK